MALLKIGIVGTGKISEIYMRNLAGMFSRRVSLAAVTDVFPEKAAEAAAAFGIAHIKNPDDMYTSDVDIVLNLTQPRFHFDVAMKAVGAGKHVYNEKPLCVTREEAAELLSAADKKGARVGCSPDTVLGAGIETCRKLLDDGWIGKPIAATAFLGDHGPESWHPAPAFYYQKGGGPLFDMGPYYITTLVKLLGPVARVCGSAKIGIPQRVITSEPQRGTRITVETPTHIAGVLDFAEGAVATLVTSFEIYAHSAPRIEIYGTEGTLSVPDPNWMGGPVKIRRLRDEEWREMPLISPHQPIERSLCGEEFNWRGLGVTEMAEAIVENRPHRASGALAAHVLDVMFGIHEASERGVYSAITTPCPRQSCQT